MSIRNLFQFLLVVLLTTLTITCNSKKNSEDIPSNIDNPVHSKNNSHDILAEIKSRNETAYFYYDDASKAMRMETDDSENDTYFDELGYMYFYNTSEGMPIGWIKSNAMASMFMGNFSFKPVAGDDHVNDVDNKVNFPFMAWANKHRKSHYEQNSNFRKDMIDCDEGSKCTAFTGIAGEEEGHFSIFNPEGHLIELGLVDQFSVKYTYGDYDVSLPNAQEVTLPF